MKTGKPRLKTSDSRRVSDRKRTDPFYLTLEWRNLVTEIVEERGRRCEAPSHQGHRFCRRVFADHIIELKDGGPLFEKSNIMLLCGSCHTRKTSTERTRRLTRFGAGVSP